jgi:hypothetical protein
VIAADPQDWRAHDYHGRALWQLGKFADAAKAFGACLRVYALFGNAWRMILSNDNITGDIFMSNVPGSWPELNALVVNLYIGNKECPTRRADSTSAQSYEARSCVLRWNGTKFTYKPL